MQQPAARRHAIGLVIEALGKHLSEILDGRRAQQSRMNGGNAIRAVRADDREIRHAHLALRAFLENAHSLDALPVTREARLHIPAHTAVDLGSPESLAEAIKFTVFKFGGIDGIVNTAAVYPVPEADGQLTPAHGQERFQ